MPLGPVLEPRIQLNCQLCDCGVQASHLLKYDSTLGTFAADVKIVDDNTLSVDGKNIRIVSSRDPLKLPWKEMGIDIVIEGTGVFVDSKGAGKHIEVRARPHSTPAC